MIFGQISDTEGTKLLKGKRGNVKRNLEIKEANFVSKNKNRKANFIDKKQL